MATIMHKKPIRPIKVLNDCEWMESDVEELARQIEATQRKLNEIIKDLNNEDAEVEHLERLRARVERQR